MLKPAGNFRNFHQGIGKKNLWAKPEGKTKEKVYYVEGPSPVSVQSRLCGWSYLIKFSIRNLSYSPCSEPSRTVLLLDVMYTMYARHPS